MESSRNEKKNKKNKKKKRQIFTSVTYYMNSQIQRKVRAIYLKNYE